MGVLSQVARLGLGPQFVSRVVLKGIQWLKFGSWVSEDMIETFRGLSTISNFCQHMFDMDYSLSELAIEEVWEPDAK